MISRRKKAASVVIGFAGLFTAYFVLSEYQKTQMDREVDRLCAVDGGIKVFERISLSLDYFNQWGDPNVPFKGNTSAAKSPYFVEIESRDLAKVDSSVFRKMTLVRFQARALRQADGKILGEAISYSRRGGDLQGPWHPSSYSGCAESGDKNLKKAVFVRNG